MTEPLGLGRMLTRQAEERPDTVALVMGARRVTYAELDVAANRLARELASRGVRAGSFVAIVLPNSPEFV